MSTESLQDLTRTSAAHPRATLAEIAAHLHAAQRLLIICHVAPDGDAIGSLLGLGWLLGGPADAAEGEGDAPLPHGREVVLACADPVPPQFQFLPGAAAILSQPPQRAWDAVVALDASDMERLGSCYQPDLYGNAPLINLDHHLTNCYFGTLNYVDPAAAATAQIVVELADALQAEISPPAATCLLTGLVTDTLSFRTSNVTPGVLEMAARLMACGANLAEITERALNQKSLNMMRLWGMALAGLRAERGVVWTRITQESRSAVGAPEMGDGGLASFLIHAPEATVCAVFSEKPDGRVEIGFRARNGWDVSGLALELGGGGHPQAAGCTIDGPIASAEARVLPLLFALSERRQGT